MNSMAKTKNSQILDPSINSLPYLFALLAHIKNVSGKNRKGSPSENFSPGQPLWTKMRLFIDTFDPLQIRYTGNEMRWLLESVVTNAVKAQDVRGSPFRSLSF